MSFIDFQNVKKTYRVKVKKEGPFAGLRNFFSGEHKDILAVDDISFSIGPGELVGYIGPNGAGKSTTIKMLTGILVPSTGTVTVAGITPYKNRTQNALNVGAVFGQRTQLWWDLPVSDSYELNKKLYRIPKDIYKKNLDNALDVLGVGDFYHTPVRQLSLGQKMRAEIGASLLHSPQILFLDEPTIGLDVVAKDKIRKYIRQINAEHNTTVILTTHDMIDVEEICDRILIIDLGKKIYDGSLESIKTAYQKNRILTVELSKSVSDFKIPGTTELTQTDNRIFQLSFHRDQYSASDLIARVSEKYPVKDVNLQDTSLEDIIREIYGAKAVNT